MVGVYVLVVVETILVLFGGMILINFAAECRKKERQEIVEDVTNKMMPRMMDATIEAMPKMAKKMMESMKEMDEI